jgi:hypothetical protein
MKAMAGGVARVGAETGCMGPTGGVEKVLGPGGAVAAVNGF